MLVHLRNRAQNVSLDAIANVIPKFRKRQQAPAIARFRDGGQEIALFLPE
jgi:hypothetical protein